MKVNRAMQALGTTASLYDPQSLFDSSDFFETEDLEEARNWGVKVYCESTLRSTQPQPGLRTRLFNRDVKSLGFGRVSYGADVTIDAGKLQSFYLFQVPIIGCERIQFGSKTVYSTPLMGTVINAETPTLIHHQAGTDKLIVRMDRDVMERHCAQHLGHALRKGLEFDAEMNVSSATGLRWMHLMKWVYEGMLTDAHALNSPMITSQLEQMVISVALASQPHNYSQELMREDPSIAPAFVKRIERYIDEHAGDAITMVDLAEHAGVSSRSIFNGFRRYRNTSPMAYLKEVRLQRVHEELQRSNASETTVTATAFRWGFNHLGHFTTDYKKRFGQSPSQTLMQ